MNRSITFHSEPAELLAVQKLRAAEIAMREAATAMQYIGRYEWAMHAEELLCAATMARQWELALRRFLKAEAGTP